MPGLSPVQRALVVSVALLLLMGALTGLTTPTASATSAAIVTQTIRVPYRPTCEWPRRSTADLHQIELEGQAAPGRCR